MNDKFIKFIMNDLKSSNKVFGYEFLDHPADVWVHAWGPTLEKAFEQCYYGLLETMIEFENIKENKDRKIEIEGHDKGSLLVAFLSEFLFLFDTEDLVFRSITIDPIEILANGNLKIHAIAHGETFKPDKHVPDTEVKAITYSYLEINEKSKRTDIKIIYDI